MRWAAFLLVCALFMCLGGCFRQTTIASTEDGPDDQWSRGVWLYGNNCAGCHGDGGIGKDDVPPIAGEGALPRLPAHEESDRTVAFETAADLFSYVKSSMPPLDVGCLSDDQLYAVTHYVLDQAEIKVPGGEVTPANAGSIKLR